MNLLTESRLQTYRRCQREEKIRYQDGIVPLDATHSLFFGSLMHVVLEAWWEPGVENRLEAAFAALERAVTPDTDQYDVVHVWELIRGYDARWGNEQYECLAVEAEFRAPLVNPITGKQSHTWEVAGKIDAIAVDPDGKTVIVEHKTSSEDIAPGSSYWARLRMNGQVSGYFRGANILGYQPTKCIYDVIGKTKLRPLKATPVESRKYKANGIIYANQREVDESPLEYGARIAADIAENPDKYYQRGTVVRLEQEMHDYDVERWQMASMMRESKRLGIAPRNPDACSRYGSTCPYFSVCAGEASLEDTAQFRKLEWIHSELSHVTKEESHE